MDGKAGRVAETEAGAEGIKITSRAQLHRRLLKSFRRLHAIIVFSPENLRIEPLFSPTARDTLIQDALMAARNVPGRFSRCRKT
jgi:hypothetical protein